MCCPSARKRRRSNSASSINSSKANSFHDINRCTPDRATDSASSDDGWSSDSDCASEIESEPECETSIDSPASSSASSWTDDEPSPKRQRTIHTHDATTTAASHRALADSGSRTDHSRVSVHRDEIVAAVLTITSALGLTKETLHVCVDLLDRYLSHTTLESPCMEKASIACLWLAVKFIETPETIAKRSIKPILKRRRHSGNWTWSEILQQEAEILDTLSFRVISPTVLSVLQAKIHSCGSSLTPEQVHLAYYFADLLLLRNRMAKVTKELLVEAIWFVITGNQLADVTAPLLAPVVFLFLAHRDNINPQHAVHKTWFALRCQYGPALEAPWQLPFDPSCDCRVCEHNGDLTAAIMPAAIRPTIDNNRET